MFGKVFLYSSGEASIFKDMGIGVHSCTYVAKYSCLVLVKFSCLVLVKYSCLVMVKYSCLVMVKYSRLVMVKLGGEPSNLTGGGGYRRRRRGRPLGWSKTQYWIQRVDPGSTQGQNM